MATDVAVNGTRSKYRSLCRRESSIPMGSQDWWLDSTAGEANWDVVIVEKNGEVLAALPYVVRRKCGLVILTQPPLTQSLGPWLREKAVKYAKRLAREKELMQALIDQLPRYAYYEQRWHYLVTNWLPFYWRGFEQTTRYTYVIEELNNLDRVWDNISSSYRNKVRKAEKLVEVRTDLSIDQFYSINMLTFSRQGISPPYSQEIVRRHDAALAERSQRRIFSAHDSSGAIHSALYLIWDNESSYLHMVGEDPLKRNSGAGIFLIWEAIRFTSQELGLDRFDFEGSMIENVERVRRDFGAKQLPYFCVRKTSSRLLRLYQALRGLR